MTGEMEFKARAPDMRTAWLQAALTAAVLTVGVVLVFPRSMQTMGTREFWDRFLQDAQIYVGIVGCIGLLIWMRLRSKYERLYVGPAALRYTSPYGGPFRALSFLQPGWSMDWTRLEKAELQVQPLGLGKRRYLLVLQGASERRVLATPLYWQREPFMPGSNVSPPRRDEAEMRRAIMNSPLVRALRNRGVQVVEVPGLVRPKGALNGYDIAEDRRLLVAVGLLLVALFYYFGDTFIDWPYMAVDNVPIWPYAVVGPLGLWLGYDLGKKAPRMERILISIMLAGSLCAACYPLILRFNALTAPEGNDLFTYTQVRPGYFKPPQADLPWIYFDNEPAYWVGLPPSGTHQFRVVKGALGFYEVDTDRVQQEIRAWWASRKLP